jgi:hypothetical protein
MPRVAAKSFVGLPAGARGTGHSRGEGAASTGWKILRTVGGRSCPDRAATTWSQFLRSQAEVLLTADFIERITLIGKRMYVLAVIEHASRRLRILGATAHPTAAWMTQIARNLVMDLEDPGTQMKYLIRDWDGKYPTMFDAILAGARITVVLSGVQIPRSPVSLFRLGAMGASNRPPPNSTCQPGGLRLRRHRRGFTPVQAAGVGRRFAVDNRVRLRPRLAL